MNQAQRNYLIDKIKETARTKRDILKDQKPERPSLAMYLYQAVMSDTFDIISKQDIMKIIKKRALQIKDRDSWLGHDGYSHSDGRDQIKFNARDLFIIPKEYEILQKKYNESESKYQEQISILNAEEETLIMRIQLASNKTLETMISEVDDMGNLSLMDTKLKQLTK